MTWCSGWFCWIPFLSWLGKLAKSLFIFPFFSFLFFSYLQLQGGAQESIMWLCHNVTMVWRRSQMVTSQVTVTVCHMIRVTWGPWESKRIATVVKCISSREMSKNSIEFSLSNSEQRGSWLNSGHRTLDTDTSSVLGFHYGHFVHHKILTWHCHAVQIFRQNKWRFAP